MQGTEGHRLENVHVNLKSYKVTLFELTISMPTYICHGMHITGDVVDWVKQR